MVSFNQDTIRKAQEAYDICVKQYNFGHDAAVGYCANVMAESNFNANLVEVGGGGGYGYNQWTPRSELYRQGKALGFSTSECEKASVQVAIACQGDKVGQWLTAAYNYDSLVVQGLTLTSFKKQKGVENTTMNFMAHWERPSYNPSINHKELRKEYAREFDKVLKGGGSGGGGEGGRNYKIDLIEKNPYSRPGAKMAGVMGIVVHEITNKENISSAKSTLNGGNGGVKMGYHILVDEGSALQVVPFDEVVYHAERNPTKIVGLKEANKKLVSVGIINKKNAGKGTLSTNLTVQLSLVVAEICEKYKLNGSSVLPAWEVDQVKEPVAWYNNPVLFSAFCDEVDAMIKFGKDVITNPDYDGGGGGTGGLQVPVFPMGGSPTLTQGPYAGFSHSRQLAYDFSPGDGGLYAPFDMVCKGVNRGEAFTAWESQREVRRADGSKGYVTFHAGHAWDHASVNVGDTKKKGERFGTVGSAGNSTGPHLHLACSKSRYTAMWDGNTNLPSPCYLEEVFSACDNTGKRNISVTGTKMKCIKDKDEAPSSNSGGGGFTSSGKPIHDILSESKYLESSMSYTQGAGRYDIRRGGSADCSAFVQTMFKKHTGKDIGSYTDGQWTNSITYKIDPSKAREGDLVFFEKTYNSSFITTHVGIVTNSNGGFVHIGSTPGTKFDNFRTNSYWSGKFYGVKRFFSDTQFKNEYGSGSKRGEIDVPYLNAKKKYVVYTVDYTPLKTEKENGSTIRRMAPGEFHRTKLIEENSNMIQLENGYWVERSSPGIEFGELEGDNGAIGKAYCKIDTKVYQKSYASSGQAYDKDGKDIIISKYSTVPIYAIENKFAQVRIGEGVEERFLWIPISPAYNEVTTIIKTSPISDIVLNQYVPITTRVKGIFNDIRDQDLEANPTDYYFEDSNLPLVPDKSLLANPYLYEIGSILEIEIPTSKESYLAMVCTNLVDGTNNPNHLYLYKGSKLDAYNMGERECKVSLLEVVKEGHKQRDFLSGEYVPKKKETGEKGFIFANESFVEEGSVFRDGES